MRLIINKQVAFQRRSGMTLMEILIASFIASIVLTMVVTLTIFATRSVLAMTNYTDLDQKSRNTLDLLTRDIRQASKLESFATNRIVLVNLDSTKCEYVYDQSKGTLTRKQGSDQSELLEGCSQLTFKIFQRAPSAGFVFNTASNNLTIAKLIDVSWKCSREIKAQKVNTESIQTAKIVMRN